MDTLQFDKASKIERLEQHLRILTVDIGERSIFTWANHGRARDYIHGEFEGLGLTPVLETYHYEQRPVSNVIAEIQGGPSPTRLFIVGAHYDSLYGTVGADDNASAVAVLLELAASLRDNRQFLDEDVRIRFVAFALEEPPAFNTPLRGSRVHVRGIRDRSEKPDGMICLEMVGYTCREKGCQVYPFPLNFMNYPEAGDFIGIVGNFPSRKFTASLLQAFQKNRALPAISLTVPFNGWIMPNIRLSDHASFWDKGFQAVMITDTAFYRNPHYHMVSDTMEKLDLSFMAELVRSLLIYFTIASP